jgi:ribonuclease D
VIGDRTLTAIAIDQPRSLNDLAEIPGMSKAQVRRHGEALLKAVRVGKQKPPTKRKRHKRRDDKVLALIDALKNWRKVTARKLGVESDIVLPRDIMEEIGAAQPSSQEELATIMKDIPWRYRQYGDRIYRITQNQKP